MRPAGTMAFYVKIKSIVYDKLFNDLNWCHVLDVANSYKNLS